MLNFYLYIIFFLLFIIIPPSQLMYNFFNKVNYQQTSHLEQKTIYIKKFKRTFQFSPSWSTYKNNLPHLIKSWEEVKITYASYKLVHIFLSRLLRECQGVLHNIIRILFIAKNSNTKRTHTSKTTN